MQEINSVSNEIISLINDWEPILKGLSQNVITLRKNTQNRTIKQITGHIIDSSSNNTHRIVHLQYQTSPLIFPNYASLGNNDRWISIQDYEHEDWSVLVQLWKYSLLHISHVMKNVNPSKLKNEWISGPGKKLTLEEMIVDFLNHLKLHLSEINDLIHKD
jgi:hypothetical protein